MAYNQRYLLKRILEIQDIAQKGFAKGKPYTVIYREEIQQQYHISYSTFNNYLSRNAKKKLEILDNNNAQNSQLNLF